MELKRETLLILNSKPSRRLLVHADDYGISAKHSKNVTITCECWDDSMDEYTKATYYIDYDGIAKLKTALKEAAEFLGIHEPIPTGLLDRNGKMICLGNMFRYSQHRGYLLPSFEAKVVWISEYACFGYLRSDEKRNAPTPFTEIHEIKNDFLDYVEVVRN